MLNCKNWLLFSFFLSFFLISDLPLIENYGFVCTVCNKSYKYRGYLTYHMKSHCESNRNWFFCNFSIIKIFLIIISSIFFFLITDFYFDTEKLRFFCTNCDKSYSQKTSLNRHKIYGCINRREVKCNLCESFFSRPTSLKRHLINVHNMQKDKKHF